MQWITRESTMENRYDQLHLHAALSRRCDYPRACKELAFVLRRGYARAPKTVQLAMYQDVLSAFRLLPGMDTIQQLSAADTLLQAVEALPQKKKIVVVSEYKQAAVAQHRRAKHQESEKRGDASQLSTDVLLHVFSFLDPCSLAMSSVVSRTWNEASNDDRLWRTHFLALFEVPNPERATTLNGMYTGGGVDLSRGQGAWRAAWAWKLSRPGSLSRSMFSNRALCMGCKGMYWLSEPPGIKVNKRSCMHQQYTFRPVSVEQVLTFLLREPDSSSSSSSSDSDTDEDFRLDRRKFSRLWAFPRLERSQHLILGRMSQD